MRTLNKQERGLRPCLLAPGWAQVRGRHSWAREEAGVLAFRSEGRGWGPGLLGLKEEGHDRGRDFGVLRRGG